MRATRSSRSSRQGAATIWTPTGSPVTAQIWDIATPAGPGRLPGVGRGRRRTGRGALPGRHRGRRPRRPLTRRRRRRLGRPRPPGRTTATPTGRPLTRHSPTRARRVSEGRRGCSSGGGAAAGLGVGAGRVVAGGCRAVVRRGRGRVGVRSRCGWSVVGGAVRVAGGCRVSVGRGVAGGHRAMAWRPGQVGCREGFCGRPAGRGVVGASRWAGCRDRGSDVLSWCGSCGSRCGGRGLGLGRRRRGRVGGGGRRRRGRRSR